METQTWFNDEPFVQYDKIKNYIDQVERWCIANQKKTKNELLVIPDSLRLMIDDILSDYDKSEIRMCMHQLLRALFTNQRDRICEVPIGMHW